MIKCATCPMKSDQTCPASPEGIDWRNEKVCGKVATDPVWYALFVGISEGDPYRIGSEISKKIDACEYRGEVVDKAIQGCKCGETRLCSRPKLERVVSMGDCFACVTNTVER